MPENNNHYSNSHSSSNGFSKSGNGLFDDSGDQDQSDQDVINLKKQFYLLWNHKWKIMGFVVGCCIIAVVLAYTTTPIFRSEGSMIISQQQSKFPGSDSDLGNLLSSTYGLGAGSTINNELQILRSRKLSMLMADSLINNPLMQNGRQYPVLFAGNPKDSAIAAKDIVAHRLRNGLNFSQLDREADLVSISYESTSPHEAAQIVNLSINVYTQLSTHQKRKSTESAVQFLDNEQQRIKKDLNTAEDQLRHFMNQEELMKVDAQTEELISRIAELRAKKQESKVKLVTVKSGIKQYKQRLNKIKPGLAEQYADAVGPNMMRLQYKLAELETQKMQILANNPSLKDYSNPPQKLQKINHKIKVFKDNIRERTKKLVQEGDQYLGFLGGSEGNIAQAVTDINKKLVKLQVDKKQYSAQMEVINEQLGKRNQFFEQLPDNMITLARLKRKVKINEQLYLTISKQHAEMSLWKETQFGQGRLLDKGYVPENQ